jgi:hypothetical protein
MISGVLRIICAWEEPNVILSVIRAYNEYLLPIEA